MVEQNAIAGGGIANSLRNRAGLNDWIYEKNNPSQPESS